LTSQPDMTQAQISQLLAAIQKEEDWREEYEERRRFALSATQNWATITGASIMAPERGMYPWLPYANNFASFLDSPSPLGVAKPVKFGFIARLHLKTSIAGEALARFAIANPEKRNAIFSWDSTKAEENLSQIAFDYKTKAIQDLFPDVVFPDDTKARFNYTKSGVTLKRQGNYKEDSIMAFGAGTNTTGKHFNGVIWIDDIVTENNYRNREVQAEIWELIQYIKDCIAEPGCQIWVTGTRYAHWDAYAPMLAEDSIIKHQIIKGYPNMGCWEEKEDGTREALFKWKYCVTPEEKGEPVIYEGKKYTPILESLDELRSGMKPIIFAAQFLNSPIVGGQSTFSASDFDNIVPCSGPELDTFLREHGALIDPERSERGTLDICIPGDPAYSDKNHNDDSVLLAVAQDQYDYWYVMNARVTHDGWKGLEAYLMQAFRWHSAYHAREFAIEAHAKEALKTVNRMLENKLHIYPHWNPLKENAGGRNSTRKNERIATALEELIRSGRLWFCVPQDQPNHPVEQFRQLLITQCMQFPSGVHDDAPDCLSNCRQSFRVRNGEQRKTLDFYPEMDQLPGGVQNFLRI